MAKLTKKQKQVAELDNEKLYTVDEAIATLRDHKANFDETVEVAMNLGVDPRHADQMVRGMVSLPGGTGKDVKVAVFARGENADKATAAGADKVGAEDLMEDMQNGNLDYDRVIATPDMMGVVGRLGKILGPKGLMPNPKLGTVTPERGTGREGRQGRPDRIPRREDGHHPLRHRQAVVQGRRPEEELRGDDPGHRESEADGCQGQVCAEDLDDFHHGSGPEDRPRRGRRRLIQGCPAKLIWRRAGEAIPWPFVHA